MGKEDQPCCCWYNLVPGPPAQGEEPEPAWLIGWSGGPPPAGWQRTGQHSGWPTLNLKKQWSSCQIPLQNNKKQQCLHSIQLKMGVVVDHPIQLHSAKNRSLPSNSTEMGSNHPIPIGIHWCWPGPIPLRIVTTKEESHWEWVQTTQLHYWEWVWTTQFHWGELEWMFLFTTHIYWEWVLATWPPKFTEDDECWAPNHTVNGHQQKAFDRSCLLMHQFDVCFHPSP